MSEPLIRRRSLPNSLRYLAQKLDEPLSDAERAGVALTLNQLANEADRDRDAFAHELLDSVRRDVDSLEERMGGHLWVGDVRELLNTRDPHASAGPVRPDEEPTL